jgi:hypothetical protein
MNNTIKIEFECPAFETELEINIVIRKDGKETVVDSTVSSPSPDKTIMTKDKNKISDTPEKVKTTKKKKEDSPEKTTSNFNGNFMNLEF